MPPYVAIIHSTGLRRLNIIIYCKKELCHI